MTQVEVWPALSLDFRPELASHLVSYSRSSGPEAPASRGGEVVSGRHLRLSGAGSKPPAAPSLETFFCSCSADLRLFLLLRYSAFSFFGICGGRARRAVSRHAASGCATEASTRAAQRRLERQSGAALRLRHFPSAAFVLPLRHAAAAAAAAGEAQRADAFICRHRYDIWPGRVMSGPKIRAER